MTARDKGAPDKGHTTLFSSSKVVHYFPNFRSYFGMEYEQPWNMGKILLELRKKPATGIEQKRSIGRFKRELRGNSIDSKDMGLKNGSNISTLN